jgi:predicted nuclease of restriction endonuclease-like RecB superfamily
MLEPRFLDAASRRRLVPVAAELAALLAGQVGKRREDVEAVLEQVAYRPRDRLVVDGLRKLLLDRCQFEVDERAVPADIRAQVFLRAAGARRELGPTQTFDREAVLRDAAASLGLEPRDVSELLFADLRSQERLTGVNYLAPQALLERYDVALAQSVLLRATRVQVALEGESPGRLRQLFRAARFHGLLHRVRRIDEGQYLIELDGPFSLFSAVSKYGLKLALFLPAVLRCERWRLRAQLLWGKRREPLSFELGPEQRLCTEERPPTGVAPELAEFVARFVALGSDWSVAQNERIFALPGEIVCIPDLVFTNAKTGEEVFLEAFGFWSKTAVWQRVETLRNGFPCRIILAVGKHLRVSEEVLDDSLEGEIYVYKNSMRPRAVLERLER